ncbi:substrate-binding periplasmic protein [Pseudoalteromonas phenolica]|uniref:ABC-type amino acid transport protein n=1 Tax=Pseudoalteromonas phenolica TaxID=161398 RepID=A0A0S2K0W8_9GAMM|nr:transporter substrate-binding domain-containing protein [Pseudoalteromonas phenolica]ALO41964.1 ABC-type amino acid transport protein [Pseudoalteromonas phenolica]MBE0353473.1 polar amino acid transport system substrate-binding protein [Pseudoalteromonas phenolica O-BC30]
MRRFTTLLCLFFLFFSCSILAQNCKKIGVVSSWPPLTVFDSEGAAGLDVEIVKLIFGEANMCFKFVRLPSSARTFEEMSKGEIDVSTMTSFTQYRLKYGTFSKSYRDEKMRLLSLKKPTTLPSLEQLVSQDKTIGLSIGSYYGAELNQLMNKQKHKDQFVSLASANSRIEMLMKERVDFIIDDIISAHYYKTSLGYSNLNVWPYVVHDNPVHLLLSHQAFDESEVTKINSAIETLKTDIDSIVMNYLTSN